MAEVGRDLSRSCRSPSQENKVVSNIQIELPVFQLVTIALVLTVGTAKERMAPYVKLCSSTRIPVTSCEMT